MAQHELVVIGSGPGGYRAAVLGALRGLDVAIVEAGVWGGTCLNRGCVPKKAWYHTARLVAAQAGFAARGVNGRIEADLDGAWRHQHGVVETVRESYVDYLKRLGVTTVKGKARFASANEILVGDRKIVANSVIIATGSRPFVPDWATLDPGRVLTTDDLFDRPPPPGRRVALIGSGVVGTELAFILSMLGLEVLWLTQSSPLSRSRFSVPARRVLAEALEERGIAPRERSRPRACRVTAAGVELDLPDGTTERVDWLLLGTGRVPNIEDLGLSRAGVTVGDDGFIGTSETTQTTAPRVFAIGDCANPAMTSNYALVEGAIAVANIVKPGARRRSEVMVPEVVYSAVELARMGLSEDEAEDAGHEVATGFAALEVSPAALAHGEPRGFARIVADQESGVLLGAEAVGISAGEWMQVIGPATQGADALARLAAAAYNHPALAEEVLNAVETLASKWGLADRVFGHPSE